MAMFRNADKRKSRWRGDQKKALRELHSSVQKVRPFIPPEFCEDHRMSFAPLEFRTEREIKTRRIEPTFREEIRDLEYEGVPRWVIFIFVIGYGPVMLWKKLTGRNGEDQLKERPGRKTVRSTPWEYIKQDFSRLWRGFLKLIRIGRMSRFRRDEISEWRKYGT